MNSGGTRTLDLLDRLVAFPTVSADSNLPLIDWVQGYLDARGFEIHRIPDSTGRKAGLFARLGPADRPGILLSGHTDVVPCEGQSWTRDPFRLQIVDGRAHGRGTTDMKGFLASVLALADRAASAPLKEPLTLAFSYDEEIGCVGIRDMIDRLPPTIGLPRMAVVGEPTSMQVAVGHKGKAAYRATCRGCGGHSALAPLFVNALHMAADFVRAMRDLQNDLVQKGARDTAYSVPYSTLHVGKLSGGVALNVVPDRALVDFELRHLAGEAPAMLDARIHAAAAGVAAGFQAQFPDAWIEVQKTNSYPGLDTDSTSHVVTLVQALAGGAGTTKVAFGTEAGYFSQHLGIPTVVCGPGSMEADGHKPDEGVALSQLAACDAMLDRLLAEISA